MNGHQRLTIKRIASVEPARKDIWLSDDDGGRGNGRLLVRVSPAGTRGFYFRHVTATGRKTVPLGPYSKNSKPGYLTLEQARSAARSVALGSKASQLPSTARSEVPLAAVAPQTQLSAEGSNAPPATQVEVAQPGESFLDLCQAYVEALRKAGKVTWKDYSYAVGRHIAKSTLAAAPARRVSAEAIADLLRPIVESGTGRAAAQLRSLIRAAYALAIRARLDPEVAPSLKRFGVTLNPAAEVSAMSKFNRTRDRSLSRTELAMFWNELHRGQEAEGDAVYRFLRITVLLGGQRCEQLNAVKIDAVKLDDDTITLLDSKGRRSTPRVHVLPLAARCRAETEVQLRLAADVGSRFLFSGQRADQPLRGDRVSKAVRKISKKLCSASPGMQPFQYRDLRRTTESHMSALRIAKEVRAHILSHGLSGVQTRHYERHDYMEEKRDALAQWEKYLLELRSA